jgi:uncharacterized protein (DUF885 family)
MRIRLALLPLLLLSLPLFAQSAADLDARRVKLAKLIDEAWQYRLQASPEFASTIGDKRWNDKLADRSMESEERDARKAREVLARLDAIGTKGFSEQETIDKIVLAQQLRNTLEDYRLKNYEMPINQLQGVYLQYPQLVSLLQFDSAKDYEDWTARMHQLPRVFEQVTAMMRRGMRDGLMPPKFLLEKAASQIEGIAAQQAEETPFAAPLKKFPSSMSEERRQQLREALLAAIRNDVLPAYTALGKFVRDDYAPHGREHEGIWSLPDGPARYAAAVKRATTTNKTPDDIHQLGLDEVARDEAEMLAIAKKLGYDSIAALNDAIEKNPDLHAKSREDILDRYRQYIALMNDKLPALFGLLPTQKVGVKSVETFREKTAPGAQYQRGTKDGSRPGMVVVNTSQAETRKIIGIESTAYHEGVPGHHLQNSIAQQLPELPPFRQQGGFIAFGEGWALYSERLGKEIGLYTDPYMDYGRLQSDILRAIRLVVDTGVHHKKWTRQQVVDYFHAHSGSMDEVAVQIETDRYIAWPAQALGYKVGQLEILRLRAKAEQALGAKFDLRAFHDQVLGAGSVPLDVLGSRIDRWIAERARS